MEVTESGVASLVSVRHDGHPRELRREADVLRAYYLDGLAWYLSHGAFFEHPWTR
jgi:hypothetical protein